MQARALTAKKNAPFPGRGSHRSPYRTSEQDRDRVPAEDEINEDHPDQESPCKDRDNNSMVNEEDQCSNAKAKAEVDELTDDHPHYRKSRHPANKIPLAAGVLRVLC